MNCLNKLFRSVDLPLVPSLGLKYDKYSGSSSCFGVHKAGPNSHVKTIILLIFLLVCKHCW